MRPNRLLPVLAITVLVVVGAAFATVAAPAMHIGAFAAAAAKTTPAAPASKAQARCDSFVANLAKRLHTDPANLKTQVKGAIDDQVTQAVKDGTINQKQADAIKKKVDGSQGCHDLPSFGGHHRGGSHLEAFNEILGAAAAALKVTPAVLKADVMSGKTLQQVAPGMKQADFDSAFKIELAKTLAPKVAAKKITAEQQTAEINEAVKLADLLWNTPLPKMGGLGGKHSFGGPPAGIPAPGSAPAPAHPIQ